MTRVWLNTTEMSEDCLYLNIWTNAIDGNRNQVDEDIWASRKRRSKNPTPNFQKLNGRPVMVWIHGGNFVSGSASLEIYNGETLASEVSPNFIRPGSEHNFIHKILFSLYHTGKRGFEYNS